ncbi:MAG: hypothetical protein Q8916_05935 [Bacteroidota bacterium]|nr:hypothetical protein [Bacteroidota bacterium]MDP4229928.1 hypothetical protein [Bacteroidota bacterium]MDP4236069.1 hypothetical protein [Bacteroidota bacterium]
MKQYPRITDEHIVAYLDGELHVSPEFKEELRAEPTLVRATAEYAALGKAMASSRADSRFMLSQKVDDRTKKMLADSLATSRKAVRTAAPAPNAAPVRSIPAQRSIKFMWAKRASIGFAFAALLAFLWFDFAGKNEQITQVPVPTHRSVTPEQTAPPAQELIAPQQAPLAVASTPVTHPAASSSLPIKKNAEVVKSEHSSDLATNSMNQAETPQAEQTKADPADIMISHRYVKLIKATPVVEVTQQDRM